MVTRVDVAKRAGVSTATVSYVINNKPGVGEATRAKVLAAMKELNYKPSYAARILKTKQTRQLTVFVNYLGDPYEAGLLNHLEKEARECGYYINFQTYQLEDEERFLREATDRIDGIFILGIQLQKSTLAALNTVKLPVISLQTPKTMTGIHAYADIDWEHGMEQLIQHLIKQGHHRIGFVENGNRHHPHEHRRIAFEAAMKNAGLTYHRSDLITGGGRLELAQSAMRKFLNEQRKQTPTAWIVASDLMAAGVLAACRDAGVLVPKDLSISGCENILMSLQTTPTLTVLDIPRARIAESAMKIMLQAIAGADVESRYETCQLIARDSTRFER